MKTPTLEILTGDVRPHLAALKAESCAITPGML